MQNYTVSPQRLAVLRPVFNRFKISSPLGERIINGIREFHTGIDFACPIGTPVRAITDGIIIRADYENDKDHLQWFGLRVWQEMRIDEQSYYVWYGHLKQLLCKEKDTVLRGEMLGFSGNTGRVSPKPTPENPQAGAHLHVQIRRKDTNVLFDADWLDT